jgi:excinuclease ABC subunit B
LHSEVKTPERAEILLKLRQGVFDCLVGINLLREGLDLPEVALVAIMDADIEGFLRDERSLIQTIGRAARNIHSIVVLYADKITRSMKAAMDETARRRSLQRAHNTEQGIVPKTVTREVAHSLSGIQQNIAAASARNKKQKKRVPKRGTPEFDQYIDMLKGQMQLAAEEGDFERAIELREEIRGLL